MSTRAQAVRPLLVGFIFTLLGCAVPPLESELEHGPTVSDIVHHINCELASVVNEAPGNTALAQRINADPSVAALVRYLTKYHFVASVLMTLDVLDAEGISPSLTFITPLNAMGTFSRSGTIVGALSGTQERNISLGYSIALEELKDKTVVNCIGPYGEIAGAGAKDSGARTGLVGDLGVTAIVVDGLRGMDAASKVNIYGNSGPTALTTSVDIKALTLQFKDKGELVFNGNMSFSPSTTDPKSPGTVTFTGTATTRDKTDSYFISLNGSTLQEGPSTSVAFSVTGTMSRLSSGNSTLAGQLGFGPKLNLAGTIDINIKKPEKSLEMQGSGVPDKPNNPPAIPVTAAGKTEKPKTLAAAAAGGAPSGPGGSPAKTTGGTSSGGSTQFGSLINFIVSYGANGGPNWTLQTFKGPAGGASSGQLLNISRTNTDTLTITFVPACKDEQNKPTPPTNFWESLPHCDQYSKSAAASAANANNVLIQSGRGL